MSDEKLRGRLTPLQLRARGVTTAELISISVTYEQPRKPPLPDINDIQDRNFTGGVRSEDYLDRLHSEGLSTLPVSDVVMELDKLLRDFNASGGENYKAGEKIKMAINTITALEAERDELKAELSACYKRSVKPPYSK